MINQTPPYVLAHPMPLFDVPGWSVPSAPLPAHAPSKKRKRHASHVQDDLQSAQENLEKLVQLLGTQETSPSKKQKSGKATSQQANHAKGKPARTKRTGDQPQKPSPKHVDPKKKNRKQKESKDTAIIGKADSRSKPSTSPQEKLELTSLQKHMKDSLGGARFRFINEKLYKSHSAAALGMMKEDPRVFHDYHVGFRHQVQSWPSNPVAHYIDQLSTYPPKTIIADLGCGDATLARALHSNGLNVLSFDLLSDEAFVVEADVCSRLPLPGSEPISNERTEGEAQIVDVIVCALSLMSTNWPGCIREAWRVLRPGGEMRIAEVASRFTDIEEFISLVRDIGFKLENKDDRNTHFTLFQFQKVAKTAMSQKQWTSLMSRSGVLKPCEYKRR